MAARCLRKCIKISAILTSFCILIIFLTHNYPGHDFTTYKAGLEFLLNINMRPDVHCSFYDISPEEIGRYLQRKQKRTIKEKRQALESYALDEERHIKDSIIKPHDFKIVIKPSVGCYNSEIVLCVLTSRDDFLIRQMVRNTWGSYAYDPANNAALIFFLGSANGTEHPDISFMIQEEARIYGDILQETYIDSYENLTYKSLSILKWVSVKCPKSKFLLKSDSDMFINVPLLVQALNEVLSARKSEPEFILGHVLLKTAPVTDRTSKWFMPKSLYNEDLYPDYASGPAYAMTRQAAKTIYLMSLHQPFFWLEDVYITGMLAFKTNVTLVDSPLVLERKREPLGCFFRDMIAGERFTPQEIAKVYCEIQNASTYCD